MIISVNLPRTLVTVDLSKPIDISIPMEFNGDQPNTYDVPISTSQPFEQDGWIGDTRKGGSCNFDTYVTTPHCNGTHTECVGHITHQRIPVNTVLRDSLVPGTLITVEPQKSSDTAERYVPAKKDEDRLITREILEKALRDFDPKFSKGLIVRTLPNSESKKRRRYAEWQTPYFSLDAMDWIAAVGFEHLIVDLPSVDRALDDGKLSAHRIYWDVPMGSFEPKEISRRTITEMVYIPDDLPDGSYLVMIQIPDWVTDAAPSRIRLFKPEHIERT